MRRSRFLSNYGVLSNDILVLLELPLNVLPVHGGVRLEMSIITAGEAILVRSLSLTGLPGVSVRHFTGRGVAKIDNVFRQIAQNHYLSIHIRQNCP